MKNIIILFVVFSIAVSCQKAQKEESPSFSIKATIANADSSMAYLMSRGDSWEVLDSVNIENETFSFKGVVSEPEMHYVRIGESRRNMIPIFLENSDFVIEGNIDSLGEAYIQGGGLHTIYSKYQTGIKSYDSRMRELYDEYMIADSLGNMSEMAKIDTMWENLDDEKISYIKNYAFENNTNVFGPYLTVSSELNYSMALPEFEELYMAFDTVLAGSKYYLKLKDRITTLKSVEIGAQMPAFSQVDTSGNVLNSDEFRGKYLLVDFWASWCGPCRRENPNVVAMYNELHDKGVGFEILGVSLDESKENWIKAIEADGLTWPHVSDLKGWSNEVADQYGVISIPHTVLVDPEGKIIAHKLRGDELREKLESLLTES